jgi:hypothetical protein
MPAGPSDRRGLRASSARVPQPRAQRCPGPPPSRPATVAPPHDPARACKLHEWRSDVPATWRDVGGSGRCHAGRIRPRPPLPAMRTGAAGARGASPCPDASRRSPSQLGAWAVQSGQPMHPAWHGMRHRPLHHHLTAHDIHHGHGNGGRGSGRRTRLAVMLLLLAVAALSLGVLITGSDGRRAAPVASPASATGQGRTPAAD